MSFLGCDVDQMTALEELFVRHSRELTTSATRVDSALSRLTWSGSDAVAFSGEWRGQARPALIATAALLESSSAEVKRNRLEQLAASDGSDVGTGAGGVGTGAGGVGTGTGGVGTGAGGVGSGAAGVGTSAVDDPVTADLPDPTAPGPLSGVPLAGKGKGGDATVDVSTKHNADGTTTTVQETTVVGIDGVEHVTKSTTTTDANGHVVSSSTEIEAPKPKKPDTEVKVDVVSGSVDAHQDVFASAGGVSGDNYAANYSAEVGASESASGAVTVGKDGVKAEGSAGVFVGAQVSGAAEAEYGVVSAGASGTAKAGASAEVNGSASVGPDGVHATAGASAEVAASVDGEAHVGVAGVTGGVEGGVGVGIGAHANVDASFGIDKVGVKVDVGTYLGIGGNISFDVSIDPKEVVTSLVDLGETIGDFGGVLSEGIPGIASAVIDDVGGWFDW